MNAFARTIAIAGLLAATAAPAAAQDTNPGGIAVGPHLSTLGPGAEASLRLGDRLVVRLGGNYFTAGVSDSLDGIGYDIDLTLASAGAAVDFHPFANGFLVSGGLYWNGNGADFKATPSSSVTIGGSTFTPAQVGTLDGKVEYSPIAPYVGIGYDGAHFGDSRFSFRVRAGLFYMGEADVTLTANGALASTSSFQAQLDRERASIEDELDVLGFYPAVTIGFAYRF